MINIFTTPKKTVDKFAEQLEQLINKSVSQKKYFYLALSGGNTPQLLFKVLKNKYLQEIDWSYVHIFWGDERCVEPESPESNYGVAFRLFLSHTNIPEKNIHRIHGEHDPKIEARRYSGELFMNTPTHKNVPKFNLIILGLGSDGHTASIFPNQMQFLESENHCEVAVHPETNQKRITITGNVINNAENISFLITGSEKSDVVSDIINKTNEFKKYPASYINLKNGKLSWYLDKAAGKLI
jgi:6-phosphogluconolactonase